MGRVACVGLRRARVRVANGVRCGFAGEPLQLRVFNRVAHRLGSLNVDHTHATFPVPSNGLLPLLPLHVGHVDASGAHVACAVRGFLFVWERATQRVAFHAPHPSLITAVQLVGGDLVCTLAGDTVSAFSPAGVPKFRARAARLLRWIDPCTIPTLDACAYACTSSQYASALRTPFVVVVTHKAGKREVNAQVVASGRDGRSITAGGGGWGTPSKGCRIKAN